MSNHEMSLDSETKQPVVFSKAMGKTIVVLVIGGLLVLSPLIALLNQKQTRSDVKLVNVTFVDENEDTIYEGINLTFQSPASGFILKSLVMHQSSYNFKWDLGFYGVSVDGGIATITLMAGKGETLILPNLELGIAIFYTFLGESQIYSFISNTFVDFKIPEADNIIGVYFNESFTGGLIEPEYRKKIYLNFAENLQNLGDIDFRVIRLVDPTIKLYMNSFRDKNHWTVFTTDVYPESILPFPYARFSTLSEYIDNGGQLAFLGGKPLGFKSGKDGLSVEAYQNMDTIFNRSIINSESIIERKSEVTYLTELGKDVLSSEVTSFDIQRPVSVEFLELYKHTYESLAQSSDGRYLDPAIVHYDNISTVVFARLRQVSSDDAAVEVAKIGSDIIAYLIKTQQGTRVSVDKQIGVSLDGGNSIDLLKLELKNNERWEKITEVDLTIGGSKEKYPISFSENTEVNGSRQFLEFVLNSTLQAGKDYSLEVQISNDGDDTPDIAKVITMTSPKPQSVDVLLYEDKRIESLISEKNSEAVLDLKSFLDTQGIKYLSISSEIFQHLVEIGYVDLPVIDVTNTISEDLLFSGSLANWFASGGQLISFGGILGLSVINQDGIVRSGTLQSFANITGIPLPALVTGSYTFENTFIGEESAIYGISRGEIAILAPSVKNTTLWALSSDGMYIGAFILPINLGKYVYLPELDYNYQKYYNVLKMVLGISLDFTFNETSKISDAQWYSDSKDTYANFLNLEIQNFHSRLSTIESIMIDGSPVTFNLDNLISGISNAVTVLLNQSTPVNDGDTVSVQILLKSGYSFGSSFDVVTTSSDIVYLEDTYLSNYLVSKPSIYVIGEISNPIVLNSEQFSIFLDQSFNSTAVNLNDYLDVSIYSSDLNNSKLLNWIASGGKFIHFGSLFGQIVLNNTIEVYSQSVLFDLFGGSIYDYSPAGIFKENETSIFSNYPINIPALVSFDYNVTSRFAVGDTAALAVITGNGDGYNFQNGTLIISTGGFSMNSFAIILNLINQEVLV